MKNSNPFLKYTNIAALLDTLLNKRIFLLDPNSWDDKNDSYYINEYKKREKLKSVLAICFAETHETFHHWKVFSDNISGVCIEFHKNKLLKHFEGVGNVIMRKVEYRKIPDLKKELDSNTKDNSLLPFYKRYPYRDEEEFRIIYKDETDDLLAKPFPIDLHCIKQVLLSYHMPEALFESISKIIHQVEGCSNLKVIKTSLIDNKKWKAIIDSNAQQNY